MLCCDFGLFRGLEAQPIAATPQALRASSTHKGMATHTQLKLRFAAHLAGEPKIAPYQPHPQGDGNSHASEAAAPKPPLLGEVARRSRDGGVSGLCYVAIPGFFPRLKAQPIEATPQALRASSTRKGMATHTQLKLRFAAHLAGEPLKAHLLGEVNKPTVHIGN